MQQTRTFTDRFFLVLKGLFMGAANKVPGVSGGVVAFVVGFYEEFIFSLQRFNGKALLLLVNLRFKSFYQYVNGSFLSPLLLGMIISYFSVSLLIDWLLIHYETMVWAAFFGMIIGSVYYIAKNFEGWNRKYLLLAFLGVAFGIFISLLKPATENDNLWFVFFCGMISVSGMTLPGLSGSFILILIGNYVLLLVDSVNAITLTIADLIQGDLSFLDNDERVQMLKVFASFLAGSIAGLITLSNVLTYLLKHFKNSVFSIITGFIAGSLGVVWPWKNKVYKLNDQGELIYDLNNNPILDQYERYWPSLSDSSTWIAIFFIFLGIIIVLALEWYGKRTVKTTHE
ncbi:DUF368 domain-containing protein [Gangjinia marincola]|uniref:DUF368 domain-containing protein n=1 Tax=Gangjinia marincola TaxID=578463 RepID=A0ABN1MIL9_9FLAO